jgi:hypothetical protein
MVPELNWLREPMDCRRAHRAKRWLVTIPEKFSGGGSPCALGCKFARHVPPALRTPPRGIVKVYTRRPGRGENLRSGHVQSQDYAPHRAAASQPISAGCPGHTVQLCRGERRRARPACRTEPCVDAHSHMDAMVLCFSCTASSQDYARSSRAASPVRATAGARPLCP